MKRKKADARRKGRPNPAARAVRTPRFRPRIVASRVAYDRRREKAETRRDAGD